MPNWTENQLIIKGSKRTLDAIQKRMQTDKNVFDFNALIPMPESLNVESGSMTDEAILVFLTDKLKFKPSKRAKRSARIYQMLGNPFSKDWPSELYNRVKDRSADKLDYLFNLGKQYVENKEKYGCTTWYEWCNRHWGTKWNACSASVSRSSSKRLAYEFLTAWDTPGPVIEALADTYPSASIEHIYRYEGDDDEYSITY